MENGCRLPLAEERLLKPHGSAWRSAGLLIPWMLPIDHPATTKQRQRSVLLLPSLAPYSLSLMQETTNMDGDGGRRNGVK